MKNILTLLFIGYYTLSNAQIITEIMYNPPEDGVDSLEYLEIYNDTDLAIDFTGYSMLGVSYTFDTIPDLAPDEYLVVCKDSVALFNNFGVSAYQWNTGALSNTGEEVGIINTLGDTIFKMVYSSETPWPINANGGGASIELCDINKDPNDATSWNLSQGFSINVILNNRRLVGSPSLPNDAACQIRDYRDIAITEILYESPAWDTDLQYLELYNYGEETINLSNWSFGGDINLPNLPNSQISPGAYYLIGSNPIGLLDFGIAMTGWGSINEISLDPVLILINPNGDTIVSLDIDEDRGFQNPDPGQALELCDPEMDNNTSLNWVISDNEISDGTDILSGTPGMNNTCSMIGTSSTSSIEIDNATSIYPNPTYSDINIISTYDIDYIEIYDQMGRMRTKAIACNNINVESLPTGSYYAKIYFGEYYAIKVFVKM